ncbi:S1C family serine protease [Nocardia vaccinii]|uniref:S1C family serine protease n=1 Tax=Nocardia vaccinii TaxID=1822 RepID=UPI001FE01504|nr:trypsin-like peptidase domain-containing protein [Nocardia vaccinii]
MTVYPNQGSRPGQPGPYGAPYGPHAPQGDRPPRHGLGFTVVAAIVLVLAVTIGMVAARSTMNGAGTRSPLAQSPGIVSQPIDSQTSTADLTAAANKVVPGIVNIDTQLGLQNGAGAGTGIVLTSDGEILTNNHVVEGATKISVTDLGNGRTYPATVVGYDRSDDLAVVRLSGASGLRTAPLGDSDRVAVGDAIVGLGNAGGTGSPTASAGQVTGLDRSITASDEAAGASEKLTGLIQVAANIQPGDSGGPLINSAGQVVGVDTAASQGFRLGTVSGQGGGQGFAIPINKALTIAKQIRAGKGSSTVHIGQSAFLGVSVSDTDGGALVRNIVAGGPAEELGLAPGDVITGVDNTAVGSALELTDAMDQHHPGDTVTLKFTDQDGQARSAQTKLAQGPVG